jgi:hypothetical protein
VYVAPAKSFQTVRSFDDLKGVLGMGDPSSVDRLVSDLHLDVLQHRSDELSASPPLVLVSSKQASKQASKQVG